MPGDGTFGNNRGGGFRGGDRRGGDRDGAFRSDRNGGGDRGASRSTPKNVDIDPQRYQGVFKWFDFEKGYGFITPSSKKSADMFAHISALEGNLLSVMRGILTDRGSFNDYPVFYQVATPKAVSGAQNGKRNFDKPFAVNISLVADADDSDGSSVVDIEEEEDMMVAIDEEDDGE